MQRRDDCQGPQQRARAEHHRDGFERVSARQRKHAHAPLHLNLLLLALILRADLGLLSLQHAQLLNLELLVRLQLDLRRLLLGLLVDELDHLWWHGAGEGARHSAQVFGARSARLANFAIQSTFAMLLSFPPHLVDLREHLRVVHDCKSGVEA